MTLLTLQEKLRDQSAKPDAGNFILLLENGSKTVCCWIDVWLGAFKSYDIGDSALYVRDFRNADVIPLMELENANQPV